MATMYVERNAMTALFRAVVNLLNYYNSTHAHALYSESDSDLELLRYWAEE